MRTQRHFPTFGPVSYTHRDVYKRQGAAWANATEKQSLTYTWYAQDKDGKEKTFDKTGKVIYLSAADIDSIMTCLLYTSRCV